MKDTRWFPPLKKRDHVKCPKCLKQVHKLKMTYPYDTYWVPKSAQRKWCEDCISDAAEEQEQRRIASFYG